MLFYRIPRTMADGGLRLRPVRIFDASFITEGFLEEGISPYRNIRPLPLWLSLWWWTRKTFLPAYCIEYDTERIGFMGLYNLRPGESAWLSLVIFVKEMRRHGYGRRAFHLLLQSLKRYSVVKRLYVEVRGDNRGALSFWRRMGFAEIKSQGGIVTMSLRVDEKT